LNFQRGRHREDPEINLIPMIDVLLVILIFVMVTTTFSQIAELQINLPTASAEKPSEKPDNINVAVDAAGHYLVNGAAVTGKTADAISLELKRAAGSNPEPVIVISADANATHQSVINVMEGARIAGYTHITFATQASTK
jgi:biopolymer transport protein ExbD